MPGFLNSIIADARPRPGLPDDAQLQHGVANSRLENPSYPGPEEQTAHYRPQQASHPPAPGINAPMPDRADQPERRPPKIMSMPTGQAATITATGEPGINPEDGRDVSMAGNPPSIERQTPPTAIAKTAATERTFVLHETVQDRPPRGINEPVPAAVEATSKPVDEMELPAKEVKARPSKTDRDNLTSSLAIENDIFPVLSNRDVAAVDKRASGNELNIGHAVSEPAAKINLPEVEQTAVQTIKAFETAKQVMLQEAEQARDAPVIHTAASEVEHAGAKDAFQSPQESLTEKADSAAAAHDSAPRVHIGQIDIVVQGDTGHTLPRQTQPTTPGDFSSRHYLRRL